MVNEPDKYRPFLATAAILALPTLVLAWAGRQTTVATALPAFTAPSPETYLWVEPLSDEMRARGMNECTPPDRLGLGPYRPYVPVAGNGRILIPQQGGATQDGGFDVIIHFHAHEAIRKMLVQAARGVAFVGIDLGAGSGAYQEHFRFPMAFPQLIDSIERALAVESGNENAHIRRLGLSAWSAGYGAVTQILANHGSKVIDAVILLDGLHATWKSPRGRGVEDASPVLIEPIFDYAKKARNGEKLFLFTHSEIDPVTYPSTRVTADLLLQELRLSRTERDGGGEDYGLTGSVDAQGVHLWSYAGVDKQAHCAHLWHFDRVLHVVEDTWQTPPMSRGTGNGE